MHNYTALLYNTLHNYTHIYMIMTNYAYSYIAMQDYACLRTHIYDYLWFSSWFVQCYTNSWNEASFVIVSYRIHLWDMFHLEGHLWGHLLDWCRARRNRVDAPSDINQRQLQTIFGGWFMVLLQRFVWVRKLFGLEPRRKRMRQGQSSLWWR